VATTANATKPNDLITADEMSETFACGRQRYFGQPIKIIRQSVSELAQRDPGKTPTKKYCAYLRETYTKCMTVKAKKSSPWRTPDQRSSDREVKRDAVLRTAAQIFNEKGYQATSLDEIAERLGVTKPTLYYYIKSKDDILFECVRIGLRMMRDGIKKTRTAGGSPVDQLIASMRIYTHIVTMDFGMCLIRIGEDPLPPDSRKELRRLKGGIDRAFRSLIELGIADGSIAPCDAKLAAFTVAGALSWVGRWYKPDGRYNPEEITDQLITVLLNGVIRREDVAPPPILSSAAGPTKSDATKTDKHGSVI
jgi:AcrR family transcriptional regulator